MLSWVKFEFISYLYKIYDFLISNKLKLQQIIHIMFGLIFSLQLNICGEECGECGECVDFGECSVEPFP